MNRKERRTAAKAGKALGKAGGKLGASTGSMADKVVAKAIEAARAGALPEAEAALDEVLARYPDHIEALHQTGMILARGDRIEEGIALLKRVVAVKPTEALYWNNLAAAEMTVGRPADALPAAQNAVRLEPKYLMAGQNLALTLGDLRQFRDQAEALAKVVRLAPGDPDNWNQLGIAEVNNGNLEAAEAALRQAVARGSRNAEYLSNLGVLLVQRGRAADAMPHLTAALELDPDRFTAALHYGMALAAGGDHDKALRWLRRATSIKPKSDQAWGALADVAMASGEKTEALDAARRAAMIAPGEYAHRQRLERFQGTAQPQPVSVVTPGADTGDLASSLDQIFIR